MRTLAPALVLAALAALPAAAQDTAAPTPAEGAAAPTAGTDALPMGEPVAPDGGRIGTPYVREEHGDWDIRCIRTESGNDPCQLYQLLTDEGGNSVAEFALFPLVPQQGDAVAGGSIITPLETLLTEQVTVAIDGGEARRYPFTFCSEVGCFARMGYAAPDIARFKAGAQASVTIVPMLAPDQRIALTVSLSGFTAGFDALTAYVQAQAEAAGLAQGQ